MEKELLHQKREELIAYKEELKEIVNEVDILLQRNNQIDEENENIFDSISKLKKEINNYEQIKRTNKFSKILTIISILAVLGVNGLSYLTPVVSVNLSATNVIATAIMSLFIGSLSSIPYFETKKQLKNINIEELKLELDKVLEKNDLNIKKYENNEMRINHLMDEIVINYQLIYSKTLELLEDEVISKEAMDYIINNNPSEEIIYKIADSIIDTPKTKVLTK